jgi:hypothetical protein
MEMTSRLKRAELTGGIGALTLGLGLGALLGSALHGAGLALTVTGATLHGVGMWHKHRLERASALPEPRWSSGLYWACWALLAALAAWLVTRAA